MLSSSDDSSSSSDEDVVTAIGSASAAPTKRKADTVKPHHPTSGKSTKSNTKKYDQSHPKERRIKPKAAAGIESNSMMPKKEQLRLVEYRQHVTPQERKAATESLRLEVEQKRWEAERAKVQALKEKALARQSLREAGVSMTEIDRLFPLN